MANAYMYMYRLKKCTGIIIFVIDAPNGNALSSLLTHRFITDSIAIYVIAIMRAFPRACASHSFSMRELTRDLNVTQL